MAVPPSRTRAGRGRAWLVIAGVAVAAVMVVTGTVQATAGGPAGPGSPGLRGSLRSLRLMNYFPADGAWQYMWTRWEPAQINADFAAMRALGATAVRITVFPGVTGFPVPSPVMQGRLVHVVALASRHRLKVQLSLFDQFTGFTDIPGSVTWARDVLRPFAGSPRVAFIDLRNELDASSTMGRAGVYRWADALLPAVRRDAHGIPVTLSVSRPQHITSLRAALRVEPDFWDLHYYSSDGLAYVIMKQAVRAAAPRPVFVGKRASPPPASPRQACPPARPRCRPTRPTTTKWSRRPRSHSAWGRRPLDPARLSPGGHPGTATSGPVRLRAAALRRGAQARGGGHRPGFPRRARQPE